MKRLGAGRPAKWHEKWQFFGSLVAVLWHFLALKWQFSISGFLLQIVRKPLQGVGDDLDLILRQVRGDVLAERLAAADNRGSIWEERARNGVEGLAQFREIFDLLRSRPRAAAHPADLKLHLRPERPEHIRGDEGLLKRPQLSPLSLGRPPAHRPIRQVEALRHFGKGEAAAQVFHQAFFPIFNA
jgi:hypothetical protein